MSQEALSSVTYSVLYDEYNKPMIINNQIYLCNVNDKTVEIYDMSEEIKSLFNLVSTTPDTTTFSKPLASSVKTHTSALSHTSTHSSSPDSHKSLSSNINKLTCASLLKPTPDKSACNKPLGSSVKTHTLTVDSSDNFENDEIYENYEFLDSSDFTSSSDIPPAVSNSTTRKKNIKKVNENDNMDNSRAVWSRESSLNLIFWYKQNVPNFNSTKIRNAVAWQILADNMENDGFIYTANQCKRHFYELRSKLYR